MIEAVLRFAPFHVVSCLKAPNQSGEHFIDRGSHSMAGGHSHHGTVDLVDFCLFLPFNILQHGRDIGGGGVAHGPDPLDLLR